MSRRKFSIVLHLLLSNTFFIGVMFFRWFFRLFSVQIYHSEHAQAGHCMIRQLHNSTCDSYWSEVSATELVTSQAMQSLSLDTLNKGDPVDRLKQA